MPGTIKVEGAARLASTLRRAGLDMADLKESNNRAGQVVGDEGRARSPHRTGRLAGSIRSARQASGVVVRAGGSGIRYARFAEFGSSKIRAHHYLYGAADAKSEEVLEIYWDGVEKALAKVQGA
jgi:HK97 gp10 family phage protein